MVCPKCDEGTVKKILFKENLKLAYWCDVCDSLWFEGESINIMTNHTLRSFLQDQDLGFTTFEVFEKGQEYEPIQKVIKV